MNTLEYKTVLTALNQLDSIEFLATEVLNNQLTLSVRALGVNGGNWGVVDTMRGQVKYYKSMDSLVTDIRRINPLFNGTFSYLIKPVIVKDDLILL